MEGKDGGAGEEQGGRAFLKTTYFSRVTESKENFAPECKDPQAKIHFGNRVHCVVSTEMQKISRQAFILKHAKAVYRLLAIL